LYFLGALNSKDDVLPFEKSNYKKRRVLHKTKVVREFEKVLRQGEGEGVLSAFKYCRRCSLSNLAHFPHCLPLKHIRAF
jgi:hypothetical protein